MVAEVRMLTLEECAAAYPQLRFAVGDAGLSGVVAESRADEPHDLGGIGKLLLGLTLAHLGQSHEGFLERSLTVSRDHRAGARTGTLRLMSGELQLSVEDAVNLVLSTGDGACVLALLDFAAAEGVDLLSEAGGLTSSLRLDAVQLSGLESGESWGEGLLGSATAASTCQLLRSLGTLDDPEDDPAVAGGASSEARQLLHGWMGKVFEPAGLASALPGYGPRRVRHQTLSGFELTAVGAQRGYSSALSLPNQAGEWVHVAAHLPPSSAGAHSPRDVSAVLGGLGLAAYLSTRN
ncbi:serine hydrolase [Nesterenkonia aurantiaca]|uniref:Beta-lactamase family protein n=1 Tax=Nesterenkonia aurantiaca TaxID=1436010 RepID=A0A4R7FZF2_9MICC|nr:serine hydrolase [Nesterenkonia aurantiaca]TDS84294.1 beta-lactamase family protein [Nesterenkonia aurantiaca]